MAMIDDGVAPRIRPRIGLALGGGVARGWAHIGAVRALRRYGIEPEVFVGGAGGWGPSGGAAG